jgi:hypothetical protein
VVALSTWAVGAVLYLALFLVLLLRLMIAPVLPAELTAPYYWIVMGASDHRAGREFGALTGLDLRLLAARIGFWAAIIAWGRRSPAWSAGSPVRSHSAGPRDAAPAHLAG